jgi:hypothetical protein
MRPDPIIQLPQKLAAKLMSEAMSHLADWPMRSAEMFRNAIIGKGAMAINPLLKIQHKDEIEYIKKRLWDTVTEGRMIDFGHIPNAVMQAESIRSHEMFSNNEFQHPYEEWLGVMSWEGGFNGYYISPHLIRKDETLVFELYGLTIPNTPLDLVLVYDIISVKQSGDEEGCSSVTPFPMDDAFLMSDIEVKKRGSNSLDPLITMLRCLADASIPIDRFDAPERLNRTRIKCGKNAIPAHTIVRTKDYVTSFNAARRLSTHSVAALGGHHASPIAHWRKAHSRTLSDGRVIPVRSTKVNWRDTEELHRLFYRIEK